MRRFSECLAFVRLYVCGGNLVVTGEWVQNKVGADTCSTPAVHEIKRQMR